MSIPRSKLGSPTFLRDVEVLEGVYSPAEDSYLILEYLTRIPIQGKKILDMGAGCGILSIYCAQQKADVTSVDIAPVAVRNIRQNVEKFGLMIKVFESDLFSLIDGVYDMILFNPPYTISQDLGDVAVNGGTAGRQVIERFLQALPNYLTEKGFALLVVSSLNRAEEFPSNFDSLHFARVASKPLFFESLILLSIKKS